MSNAIATLWQDVRYGLRLLVKSPGFSVIAVLTLALGIGANTAIFSLINAVMLRSLPIEDAGNVVVLQWSAHKSPSYHWYSSYGDTGRTGGNPSGFSFSKSFLERVQGSDVFSGVAGFANGGPLALSGNGPATNVRGEAVSGGFFSTLGIKPAAGRLLTAADDRPDAPPATVLDYAYWQKAFGGNQDAIGKVIKLNGVAFTIVGVTDADYPGLTFGNTLDLYLPISLTGAINPRFVRRNGDPAAWWALIAARLKPGVPKEQAQAAISLIFQDEVLHGEKPMSKPGDQPAIQLLSAQKALVGESGKFADPLRILMAAVGIVLLIACANVAGLVLSRANGRRREIAVRLALGARRRRLLRQLLTESVILSLFGGILGILLAYWGAHTIVAMISSGEDRSLGFSANIDLRVLAFTALVSILTGIVFGLAPAMRSLRLDLTPTLKDASSGVQQGRSRWFSMGNALVVLQAALAVVLLMGAGLLVHTFSNLKNLDPGFDTRNVLTFALNPSLAGYKRTQIDNLYRDLQQEIGSLPGVKSVSYSESPLLAGSWSRTSFRYMPPGKSKPEEVEADWMPISSDFFSTLRIPVMAGRMFTQADFDQTAAHDAAGETQQAAKPGTPPPAAPTVPVPAIVNDLFAKKYFPGVNPLGQRFGSEDGSDPERPKDPGYEVVGIVQNAKYNNLRREIDPTMYVPLSGSAASFEIRTATDPHGLIGPVRSLIGQHDNNLPMNSVRTQSEHIERLLRQERIIAQLSSFFGLVSLLLACIGLYGLLSYEVSRRTREIGIRMALGAQRGDLIRLVVWQGVALALVGTAIGVASAIGIGRLLTKVLYGVKPDDPITLGAVSALLVVVALGAAMIPARRATTVDPMIALRYE